MRRSLAEGRPPRPRTVCLLTAVELFQPALPLMPSPLSCSVRSTGEKREGKERGSEEGKRKGGGREGERGREAGKEVSRKSYLGTK